jgi:hypothetical protein
MFGVPLEARLRIHAIAALGAYPTAIWICSCVLIAVAGCAKPARDDMSWAQSALERNGQLQVLSVDRQARSFTVRLKDSGELRIVQADEVVGGLPIAVAAAPAANPVAAPSVTQAAPAAPLSAAPPEAAAAVPPPDAASAAAASGPGVLASGPGYSIKTARTDGMSNTHASAFAPNDSIGRGLVLERRDEPIICQGARFLRIDSRNLEFAGDAISAEDGCEIHITNSRIAAKGVGVSVRAANVHIANSSIEGLSGSILASDGAQVYAQSSRFRGVSRGLTSETMHDLGGNVWN